MSTGGGREIRAGKAFVELGLRNNLAKGLNRASAQLRAFSARLASIGVGLVGVGGSILAPLFKAIGMASDMAEAMSKFDTVFGESAGAVKEWSDNFAKSVGRSKRQIVEFMGSTQDLFVPLGFEPGAATELSKQITELAVDLASFNNMADEDVMRDLHAALTGSGEVMKKYGVLVSEAAVKQELLNQGLDPATATQQQKVMARLAIIMRGTTAAQGDAIKTAGGFANQMKALRASVEDAAVAIGTALLPIVTPLVTKLREAIEILGKLIEANKRVVVWVAAVGAGLLLAGVILLGISATVSTLAFALSGIVTIGGAIASAFGMIATAIGAMLTPIGVVIAAMAALGGVIVYFSGMGAAALRWLMDAFSNLWRHTQGVLNGIADALMAGELMLAAQILWQGIKVAWLEGTRDIKVMWIQFKLIALGVFDSIYFGAARMFQKLVFEASKAAFKMAAMMHEHLGIGNMTQEMADMAVFALEVAQGVEEDKINRLEEQVRRERLEGAMEDAKATDEEIREAKRKLEELKEEARRKREAQEMPGDPPLPSPHAFPGFEGLALGLQNGAAAIGAFGAAGGRLGMATPGDAFRQMNGHLENIEDDIAEVADAARNQALVFNP